MAAHGQYWDKRDRRIALACRQAASLIRAFLAGERVDGRTYGGLHARLLRLEARGANLQGYPNFFRARETLSALYAKPRVR
ncbi:hypothetical protein J5474_15845 [Sagittula sp. M10.9X]|uniref:Uncharacterized protein n=2 Tax=Sagittula salina TaxID=2820268 RepID=A0A940MSP3_9RHOB|nr:hypothetical protein [Sagittula salina]